MNYQKEMPGYALELASSMELIYFDIYRSGEFISNPTKELLEKHIMLSMGVPEIIRRYEKMKSVHVICNNTLLIRIFMEMME